MLIQPFRRALASPIPGPAQRLVAYRPPLLEAVYRALLKRANRSLRLPLPSFVEAAELNAKIAADEVKIALGSPPEGSVLTPLDYNESDKVSKYKGTPPSGTDFKPATPTLGNRTRPRAAFRTLGVLS